MTEPTDEGWWGRVLRLLAREAARRDAPRYALHLYAELASQSVGRSSRRLYFRGIDDLADDLGITDKAARAGVTWLHDHGWITRHLMVRVSGSRKYQRAKPGDVANGPSEFAVHDEPVRAPRGVDQRESPSTGGGSINARGRGVDERQGEDWRSTPVQEREKKERTSKERPSPRGASAPGSVAALAAPGQGEGESVGTSNDNNLLALLADDDSGTVLVEFPRTPKGLVAAWTAGGGPEKHRQHAMSHALFVKRSLTDDTSWLEAAAGAYTCANTSGHYTFSDCITPGVMTAEPHVDGITAVPPARDNDWEVGSSLLVALSNAGVPPRSHRLMRDLFDGASRLPDVLATHADDLTADVVAAAKEAAADRYPEADWTAVDDCLHERDQARFFPDTERPASDTHHEEEA